jgi:16S rRNA processing protein RimM
VSEGRDFVLIGFLRRAHGVRGEISAEQVSDVPGRFLDLEYVLLRKGGRTWELAVESVRTKARLFLLKLEGIDDRDAARDLTGAEIGVRKEDIPPAPEDTYYQFDLVGCMVLGESGREIGRVEDVLKMPANDVLVVRSGDREVLLPVVKAIIKEVDPEAGRITILEMEGLLD